MGQNRTFQGWQTDILELLTQSRFLTVWDNVLRANIEIKIPIYILFWPPHRLSLSIVLEIASSSSLFVLPADVVSYSVVSAWPSRKLSLHGNYNAGLFDAKSWQQWNLNREAAASRMRLWTSEHLGRRGRRRYYTTRAVPAAAATCYFLATGSDNSV